MSDKYIVKEGNQKFEYELLPDVLEHGEIVGWHKIQVLYKGKQLTEQDLLAKIRRPPSE